VSIRLYNGFRVIGETDPFIAAMSIRRVLEPYWYQSITTIMETYHDLPEGSRWSDIPEFFDDDTVIDKRRLPVEVIDRVERFHQSRTVELTDADIAYDVTLMRSGDGEGLLGLLFTQAAAASTVLMSSGVVEEYGYWDNADHPGISEYAWSERERAWSPLVSGDDVPAAIGLSFSSPGRMLTLDHLQAALGSLR
jgi:hypothetical protein